jgi:hypothetical protein
VGAMNAYVKSGYTRSKDDHYPTIDDRCVRALWESWPVPSPIWDICAPNGSGIADAWPGNAHCTGDALNAPVPDGAMSIVTNPPYASGICDDIVWRCRDLVTDGQVYMAALLLRPQWDYAPDGKPKLHKGRSRAALFDSAPFAGVVKLRFRPWWKEDRSTTPIHHSQWIIFDRRHRAEPVTRSWPLWGSQ